MGVNTLVMQHLVVDMAMATPINNTGADTASFKKNYDLECVVHGT